MKQTIEKDISFKRLSENEDYYKYIFKKTEKVVSAVFYILSNIEKDENKRPLIEDIQVRTRTVHERALETLSHFEHAADEILTTLSHDIIALDSTVRVAAAAAVIPQPVAATLLHEIDVILRGITNRYLRKVMAFGMIETGSNSTSASRRRTTSANTTEPTTEPAVTTESPQSGERPTGFVPDRRNRIKTILEAKGESTIKDISDIITDVSEKTIQRELNAMIEENIIRREGQRRWSKYVLN